MDQQFAKHVETGLIIRILGSYLNTYLPNDVRGNLLNIISNPDDARWLAVEMEISRCEGSMRPERAQKRPYESDEEESERDLKRLHESDEEQQVLEIYPYNSLSTLPMEMGTALGSARSSNTGVVRIGESHGVEIGIFPRYGLMPEEPISASFSPDGRPSKLNDFEFKGPKELFVNLRRTYEAYLEMINYYLNHGANDTKKIYGEDTVAISLAVWGNWRSFTAGMEDGKYWRLYIPQRINRNDATLTSRQMNEVRELMDALSDQILEAWMICDPDAGITSTADLRKRLEMWQ